MTTELKYSQEQLRTLLETIKCLALTLDASHEGAGGHTKLITKELNDMGIDLWIDDPSKNDRLKEAK